MNWQQLISNQRLGQEHRHTERHDDRTEFKRDYDRLIFSAPFRRLQNKTQVFPLPGSIFVHNRLTHSLEVASVGMSLGNDVTRILTQKHPELRGTNFEQIGTIVATACLAHDMGNPPFGHSGEKAIQTFFSEGPGQELKSAVSSGFWDDITHFEGNAYAFRLLTHSFNGRRKGGFVMTYSTLGSIVKYPYSSSCPSKKGKFGFFYSEADTFRKIADEMGIIETSSPTEGAFRFVRHPLVYLVEAADDICYEIMDIEDAHKLKLISYEETKELMLAFFDEMDQKRILKRIEDEELTDENERVVYLRACVIGKLENECVHVFTDHEEEILAGTFEGTLIKRTPENIRKAYERCAELSVERIYRSKPVLDVELSGYKIIETLLTTFTDAAIHPERFHSKQLLNLVSPQYDIRNPNLESRIMAVIDYLCGMTDVFALDIYQKINGISLPIV
ncbi:MAG: deoxyguanosinetriphosphate triphosphohydrolase [Prevotella sp.]|nr:deoxyguanosinetriphosphate triphosphohydrolase [Prevotella sp.]MBQ9533729.1 deoxyguanosinetriphosphate triphosphohydrolase [Prevotella sp.]